MNLRRNAITLMLILSLSFSLSIGQERLELDVMPANGQMLIGADYYPEHWPESRLSLIHI